MLVAAAPRLRRLGYRFASARGMTPKVTMLAVEGMKNWDSNNLRGTPPVRILLRKVTNKNYGPIGPHGGVSPLIKNRLAWLVLDADAHVCPASVGPVLPGRTQESPGSLCRHGGLLTVIDAQSGRVLGGLVGF